MDIDKLIEYYQQEDNITRAAKRYAKENGISYTDNFRKKCSNWINKASEGNPKQLGYKSPVKVLLFDIETSPLLVRAWTLWNPTISTEDIVEDWSVLCFGAKWLFEEDVITDKLTYDELLVRDDERITRHLWNLLDEAAIVISHNGKKFDHKKMNTKFLKYGLNLPSPYQVIDTLEHAKKKFKITSNRLDYISKFLGFEGKMETPKGMWKRVMENDYESLEIMDEYCQRDVIELENVYLKMRPYIQPHPNIGLHIGENVECCPSCGHEELDWDQKQPYRTNTNEYKSFRCTSCGSIGKSRTATYSRKDISNLTTPNSR